VFVDQRKQRILHLVSENHSVRVSEICTLLQASEATIRRDLKELHQSGALKRTHGGAVSNQIAAFELSVAEKEDRFKAEKIAIARMAADLVQQGDTIMLDAGTTTLQIARQIKQRRNISVVANSLNIAWELTDSEIDVTLIGGILRGKALSLVGPLTEQDLSRLHVDKLFLGTNGVDLKSGLTTPNLIEAQTKMAMVEIASEVIVVTDRSKFGRVSFSQFCPLKRVDALITDEQAPTEFLHALEEQGLKVLLATSSCETPDI
jgi:DeoR family transcriptional regulator, fructose operon transcriptional repressor